MFSVDLLRFASTLSRAHRRVQESRPAASERCAPAPATKESGGVESIMPGRLIHLRGQLTFLRGRTRLCRYDAHAAIANVTIQ
jgi:hypothetical protein